MLEDEMVLAPEAGEDAGDARVAEVPASAPPAVVAARLAAADLADLIHVSENGARAEAVAAVLRAIAPDRDVVLLLHADGLPGDDMPATPANSGRRVAAFARLARRGDRPVALVTTAEAAARLYPPPAAFSDDPPRFVVGDAFDAETWTGRLEALGYFLDDRVDEAGEFAVRGNVMDLFPADAERPLRIELADGAIAAIRAYDPVTQRGGDLLETVAIGPVDEPAGAEATLFDHLPAAAVALDAGAATRRDRFLDLVEDGARTRRANRAPRLVVPVATGEAWETALANRRVIDAAADGVEPGERFVEARQPQRAVVKAVKAARAAGEAVVLAGGARDLRFLSARMAKLLGETPEPAADWAAVRAAAKGALLSLDAPITRGWREPGLMVIAAADLLGARAGDEGVVATIDR